MTEGRVAVLTFLTEVGYASFSCELVLGRFLVYAFEHSLVLIQNASLVMSHKCLGFRCQQLFDSLCGHRNLVLLQIENKEFPFVLNYCLEL